MNKEEAMLGYLAEIRNVSRFEWNLGEKTRFCLFRSVNQNDVEFERSRCISKTDRSSRTNQRNDFAKCSR